MTNILRSGQNTLAEEYQQKLYGGSKLWAEPEEARRVGAQILDQLCKRYGVEDQRDDNPGMPEQAPSVISDALDAIDVAGLPTERRVNILHGLIDAAAEAGLLGGEPEGARDYED